jgi:hypothetical protein
LGGFDILGHADKMHYNSACYRPDLLDEPWYEKQMQDYFARIAEKGYMVEINSKAYHLYGTFFPNERYFPLLKELGIRVMVNSDAHYPERINNSRAEALAALKKVGFDTVVDERQHRVGKAVQNAGQHQDETDGCSGNAVADAGRIAGHTDERVDAHTDQRVAGVADDLPCFGAAVLYAVNF